LMKINVPFRGVRREVRCFVAKSQCHNYFRSSCLRPFCRREREITEGLRRFNSDFSPLDGRRHTLILPP
jgi:hypothetical protein